MAAVELQDLKAHLTPSGSDGEQQRVLDAAIALVEERVGPLTATDVTEVHVVLGPTLVLEQCPVAEIISIEVGSVPVASAQYRLDQRSGIVRALGGRSFAGEYTVTYKAGWDAPPAELQLAVLLIAAQLWETQQVPGRRPQFGQPDGAVPAGFAVPRRAAELMAPHLKGHLP